MSEAYEQHLLQRFLGLKGWGGISGGWSSIFSLDVMLSVRGDILKYFCVCVSLKIHLFTFDEYISFQFCTYKFYVHTRNKYVRIYIRIYRVHT